MDQRLKQMERERRGMPYNAVSPCLFDSISLPKVVAGASHVFFAHGLGETDNEGAIITESVTNLQNGYRLPAHQAFVIREIEIVTVWRDGWAVETRLPPELAWRSMFTLQIGCKEYETGPLAHINGSSMRLLIERELPSLVNFQVAVRWGASKVFLNDPLDGIPLVARMQLKGLLLRPAA